MSQAALFRTTCAGDVDDPTTDGPGWCVLEHEPVPDRRGKQGFRGDRTYPCWRVGYQLRKGQMTGCGFIGRFPDEDRAHTHIRMLAHHRLGTLDGVTITCEELERTEIEND